MALLASYGLLAFCAVSINAQLMKNPCFDYDTCPSCISNPLCKWIKNMDDNYKESPDTQQGKQHCVRRDSKIVFTAGDVHEAPLVQTSAGLVSHGGLTINPSDLKSESTIGDEIKFSTTVRPIRAIKLNIYFLVHLTQSLKPITDKILQNFEATVQEWKKFDQNLKIGMGMFSDIPVFPFVKLPPVGSTTNEMPGYVFSNLQSIEPAPRDLSAFKNLFTGSDNRAIDKPESVIDAMAQVSECEQIGWNKDNDVFRLLIVVTDSISKRAGHGNIIGHYRPNNGKCKVKAGENTLKTIDTDYVHPHLLEESLSKNNIRVLILTEEDKMDYYTLLTESFKHQVIGIEDYGKITADEFMKKIKNAVTEQKRPIKFNVEYLKSQFDVSHSLTCPGSPTPIKDTLECAEVGHADSATLAVTIKYSQPTCPTTPIITYVKVNGFFRYLITAKFTCSCDCQTGGLSVLDPKCSSHGKLVCGKCVCVGDWEGDKCQCPKNQNLPSGPNVECNAQKTCGPYGKCVCGKCICPNSPEQFYGPECKSSDLVCPLTQYGLCNGKGRCVAGVCICNPGFTEPDCSKMDCSNPNKNNECKRTETSDECSGKGTCTCGKCTCNPGFMGTYCHSIQLPTVRCSDVTECMMDYFAGTKTTTCDKPFTIVEKLDEPTSYFTAICSEIYQNCEREFLIHINPDGSVIDRIEVKRLNPSTECFQSPNFTKTILLVLGITSGVTITLFVTGCFIYHHFKKNKILRTEVEREQRRWVLNSRSQSGANTQLPQPSS